jgi:hypothetical protein
VGGQTGTPGIVTLKDEEGGHAGPARAIDDETTHGTKEDLVMKNTAAALRCNWRSVHAAWVVTAILTAACGDGNVPTATAIRAGLEAAHAHDGGVASKVAAVNASLLALRAATVKYHDLSAAEADGYQLGYRGVVTGCIANPGVGAMGYHYFNWARMDDPSVIEDEPEVLVYHPVGNGKLVLGAVEWVVPKTLWEDAGQNSPPVVFGQFLHILNPVLNWYVAHAWIWKANPSGIFADWNPRVRCP